jgi:hypothetical protein
MGNKQGMVLDHYANKMYGQVVESAANTLTFEEINTNISYFSRQAFVLHRLEWYPAPTSLSVLGGAGDYFECALTSSNKITMLNLDDPGVIDLLTITQNFQSGVGFFIKPFPIIREFTDLPGGGLIINPRPLYLAVKGTSLASALTINLRAYFTVVELNSDQYVEMLDFYRILGT